MLLLTGSLCLAAEPTLLEQAYALDATKGSARNAKRVAELYRQAAAQGDAHAHSRLGYLYETGDGVAQSYEQARRNYEAAVAAGLVEARLRLAICHLEGWGGPVDKPAFAREIRVAAEAGYQPAQYILARLFLLGFAVPKDREQSVLWFERAAAKGDAEAQVAAGITVANRDRGPQWHRDMELARTWFQRSAEQEYSAGMLQMAKTFLKGNRADRDWALGRRWLELATENGDAVAPYTLALYTLLHVDAPSRDEAQARAWLKLSAERGESEAAEVLELHEAGKPLAEAAYYVYVTPYTERYVKRMANKPETGVTRKPQVYYMVDPIYPESLLLVGTEGEALVEFTVDASGAVVNAKPVRAPHPLLGESAVAAVRQWRFRAGLKDGKPISSTMQVPVRFKLGHDIAGNADDALRGIARIASRRGEAVRADAVNLSLGKRVGRLAYPPGVKIPDDLWATFILVLDATGKPVRGHVLNCEPEQASELALSVVLASRFEPRLVNGVAEGSNIVYAIRRNQPRDPTIRNPSASTPAAGATEKSGSKKE